MKPKTPIYGLMAEFLDAAAVLGRHAPRPAGRLSRDGCLHALPGRRAGRRSWA